MKKKAPAPAKVEEAHTTSEFTRQLAAEIVKNLTTIKRFTATPFTKLDQARKDREQRSRAQAAAIGEYPILVDTSVLIDGRILPIANSGFLTGTLIIPQFVLAELQHIADSDDSLRRAKGRRGLEITNKLKTQKNNALLQTKIIAEDAPGTPEVDHKLVELAKKWSAHKIRLMTLDFNLAHLARAQSVKVLSVQDMAQALKMSLIPGEETLVRITHEGKERQQGVGYLPDGTMIVVEDAKDNVGIEIAVIVTKVHQTPAGQLFFARKK